MRDELCATESDAGSKEGEFPFNQRSTETDDHKTSLFDVDARDRDG